MEKSNMKLRKKSLATLCIHTLIMLCLVYLASELSNEYLSKTTVKTTVTIDGNNLYTTKLKMGVK